jgi:hypothetical protein
MDPETQTSPTMLGGITDSVPDDSGLPPEAHGAWRIELRHLPITHRSHAFLTLVGPDGQVRGEPHGLAYSRNARILGPDEIEEPMTMGIDGSRLKGLYTDRRSKIGQKSEKVGDVAYGTYDDVVRASGLGGSKSPTRSTSAISTTRQTT